MIRLPAAGTSIGLACQTYSWHMSFDRYADAFDHIAATVADSGFPAIEPEVVMLGRYRQPDRLRPLLAERGIGLAALCLALDWRYPAESPQERQMADEAIALVAGFPGAVLNVCQLPGPDRQDLPERQRNLIACVNDVAARAADSGVHCTYHPNSPDGSIFRLAPDYEILLGGLTPDIGFTPDLGHVGRGGMDPLATVRTYRERIDHIHFKDMSDDGTWVPTGAGVVDFVGVTEFLHRTGFTGWIVLEDESPQAEGDPDAATTNNARYAASTLLPVLKSGRVTPQ